MKAQNLQLAKEKTMIQGKNAQHKVTQLFGGEIRLLSIALYLKMEVKRWENMYGKLQDQLNKHLAGLLSLHPCFPRVSL